MKRPALDQQQISQGLGGGYWRVSVLDEVTSTQLLLRQSNPMPGAVMVAEYQSHGRGRLGRSFDSISGTGLLFSAYVRPKIENADLGLLPLLVGMTIADVLNKRSNSNCYLTKWPNDVVASSGKIAGVLCEYFDDGVLIGIGINVSAETSELPVPTASSILLESGIQVDRNELLISLLTALEENIAAWEAGSNFMANYLRLSSTVNQLVEVTLPGKRVLNSTAIGISATGGLILASGETITVGDVLHVRNQESLPLARNFPKVGVIGAGQLARMLAVPANYLGIDFEVFSQSATDSAAQICKFVIGDYKNSEAVVAFAKSCDVVTFEHELIPQSVIKEIEKTGVKVYPSSASFIFSQNKIEMRKRCEVLGLPNPKWEIYVGEKPGLELPLIAKMPMGGYDGRGVYVISNIEELENLYATIKSPILLEEKLNFTCEISVMVARSPHGQAATWPATLTVQSDGICTSTITPVPDLSEELAIQAQSIALSIAAGISLVGVMAVEMFLVGDQLIINELALRPHNSGHWSIEGAVTSQFEQHLRAILDLPLGSTSMVDEYAVMGNLLGGEKSDMYRPYLHLMARNPALHIHQYGKEVRPGRKIGHVTAIGSDLLELRNEIEHAVEYMSGAIDE